MKKQRLKAKLTLNKETLGNLTKAEMRSIKGGATAECLPTYECVPAPSIKGGTQSWCACE